MSSSYQNGAANNEEYNDLLDRDVAKTKKRQSLTIIGAFAFLVAIILGVTLMNKPKEDSLSIGSEPIQSGNVDVGKDGELKLFDDLNRYVFEDYDARSTFASFLPGVAGYFGKPVWAFYVNRGQGISTFGTLSKEYPMLEFNAANKAYQSTPFVGFRTFIRGSRGLKKESFNVEPFAPSNSRNPDKKDDDPTKPKRIMFVGNNEMEIRETDSVNDITTSVEYFVLPEEKFASLIRRSTFKNNGSGPVTLDILDGLAKMEPAGGRLDWGLKEMGRTLEGWFGVYHAEDGDLTMPFYKMSTEPSDKASVVIEYAGHYCLAFIESEDSTAELLPIVYDTTKVFGKTTSLHHPSALDASSVADILATPQYGFARTSSAFAAVDQVTLQAGESITIGSVYGKASAIEKVGEIAQVVTQPGYMSKKSKRARDLMNELTEGVETNTVNKLFNGAVRQMFLDNSIRGGLPTIVGNVNNDKTYDEDDGVKVFHAFSRIHGDLERDYNTFKIEAGYFSQGPGNYRDIAQNRRNDVTFVPKLGSFDIQQFLSFIQADGYEPLTVESIVFIFNDPEKVAEIAKQVTADPESEKVLSAVLNGGPFRPGQVFDLCDELDISLTFSDEEFINILTASAEDLPMATFGQGYWGDHWDYYIDLIESYLNIFPDQEENLMYNNKLRYFFSTATVKPRNQKYVLDLNVDATGKHVMQLESTVFDSDKVAEQEAFRNSKSGLIGIEAEWQRTTDGVPFMSTPIAKLFLLGAIKFATRDVYGMGVEYEGGRPGWLDSMNGLPGMIGSGMPETNELLLLLKYVLKVVESYDRPIEIPSELDKMVTTINTALDELNESGFKDVEALEELPEDVPSELFTYWDVVACARENYRNDVQYYFSGNETEYSASKVSDMITKWIEQVEIGIKRAMYFSTKGFADDGTSGVPPSYFSYNVTDFVETGEKNDVGHPLVNAKAMRVKVFPQFLEGPVRYMKTIQDDKDQMRDIYQKVLKSGLRDKKLNMYFLSSSLEGQTYDMGRQIAFAPGWLENQSIWVHMSYKYYLQLLRGKLFKEFFDEMKGGGILPFMDPKVYGRSLMECSSFIASSAFPDPALHGEGFVARLSGSTAEFMHMWKLMFLGSKLFYLNDEGDVEMQLVPALPSWLFEDETSDSDPEFDEDGSHIISFKLFTKILVTYHNAGGNDIYDVPPKKYIIEMKNGTINDVDGPIIPTGYAIAIRRVSQVKSIDAFY